MHECEHPSHEVCFDGTVFGPCGFVNGELSCPGRCIPVGDCGCWCHKLDPLNKARLFWGLDVEVSQD